MAETLNMSELAAAISEGRTLSQIAAQTGYTSLIVARVLYGHYAHAALPAGLTGQALRYYMTLRHDAIRLCQKAGVGPLDPGKEDAELPKLRKEIRGTLSRASLAGDLDAGRSIAEMARKRGVTERTIRGYLHRHGLLDAKPHASGQASAAIACEDIEGQLSDMAAAAKSTSDKREEGVAPQSHSEPPRGVRPPETTKGPSKGSVDNPAPQTRAGRGIVEDDLPLQPERGGGVVSYPPHHRPTETEASEAFRKLIHRVAENDPQPTFACQIDSAAIAINLTDDNLSPAQVRQYLRVVEGNLELAAEGLELRLFIRGPRR